jgi:hypothetical protein
VDEQQLQERIKYLTNKSFTLLVDSIVPGTSQLLAGMNFDQLLSATETPDLAVKAPRQGIAGFTPAQLLTLVLVWLVLLAEPEVVPKLHPAVQEVANGEVGTVGLAVALTVIMASRLGSGKKD